jgi:hypothetical protein
MESDVAERLAGKRYVRVVTLFETSLPEKAARQHMKDTVEAWLQANEKREGVEYDIVISDQREPWVFAMGPNAGSAPGTGVGRPTAGRPGGSAYAGRPGSSSGSGDVNRIAPLTKPEGAPEVAGTFTVVWYALLDNKTQGGDS